MTGSFRLARDEVHCWCVPLHGPPDISPGLYGTLSREERARSARLRFPRDRQRFLVARGVLRELLGGYLGTDPGSLRFVYNAFGKPALGPEFGGRIRFNLSHSADRAVIAIAPQVDVGVDVERIQARLDYAAIARRFFSAAEVDQLSGLPGHLQPKAFFRSWTQKEAHLKACGEGLVNLDRAADAVGPTRHWSLYTLEPASGYVGALAVEGSGWRLSQRRWRRL